MNNNQFINPGVNQEILYRLISLENEVKLLKEENQKQQSEINYLKENAIREKIDTLYPKDLKFNYIKLENNAIILNNENSCQYGPYLNYKEGRYCIIYHGNNLNQLNFDCCKDEGKNILNISMLYKSSKKIAYDVFLPENNKNIEFRAKGSKNCYSFIEKIEIYRYNF